MKYIAYCRKSSDEKDRQVLSIPAQVEVLKEYAKRENLDGVIEAEIYKNKRNEFFEEKLKISEEMEKIKQNGSS